MKYKSLQTQLKAGQLTNMTIQIRVKADAAAALFVHHPEPRSLPMFPCIYTSIMFPCQPNFVCRYHSQLTMYCGTYIPWYLCSSVPMLPFTCVLWYLSPLTQLSLRYKSNTLEDEAPIHQSISCFITPHKQNTLILELIHMRQILDPSNPKRPFYLFPSIFKGGFIRYLNQSSTKRSVRQSLS